TDDVEVAGVQATLLRNGALAGSVAATAGADGVYSAEFAGVNDGTYTVRFTATDTSGNTATADTAAVEVDTTLEVGEPYPADDGLTVTLNSITVIEDEDGYGYNYTISYTYYNDTDAPIAAGHWMA